MLKKAFLIGATVALLPTPVLAKGCLKGAAVGGVGGHFVGKGHAVAGAAIGCAVGHHRAKVAAKQQAAAQPAPPPKR
ncbi:outer membrane lipoprotein SlyB [Sphingomonas vulcanisoli]|uniref:Outer membrane lipoprotein SlyB n=1 Tax=Sphingomonas vulcanisoli TaxID=1658060 RepID=A0ABX0TYV7_9SPHN|nr:outer membrane lipoprotein SlyB [Sphingomonas vulcanisoli]